jgi:hypothetical protein
MPGGMPLGIPGGMPGGWVIIAGVPVISDLAPVP